MTLLSTTTAAAPDIVPIDTGDSLAELLELWHRNIEGHWPQWAAWILTNPSGPLHTWAAHDEQDRIFGSTSLLRRPIRIGNQHCMAGQAIHISVDADRRSGQIATRLQRKLLEHVHQNDIAVVFGVTRTAAAVMRRVGYRHIGTSQRFTKPLRTAYKLIDRLRSRILCAPVALACDTGLKLTAYETWQPRPSGLEFAESESFDAKVDRLWERVWPQFPILGNRTQVALNWRFHKRPYPNHRVLNAIDRTGELRGYLVWSRSHSVEDGNCRYAEIRDILFDSPEVLAQLLGDFCRRMRASDADAITMRYLGAPLVPQTLKRFGFHHRGERSPLFAYINPRCPAVDVGCLEQRGRWHMTDAELDY